MQTILTFIHLTVSFILVFVVLVQSSKGAQMGAAFGGSSQTVFGARGTATFLSKLTTITAVVFMLTSLFLAIMDVRTATIIPHAPAASAPAAPAAGPAGGVTTKPVLPPAPDKPDNKESGQTAPPAASQEGASSGTVTVPVGAEPASPSKK